MHFDLKEARRLLYDYRTLNGIKVEDDSIASYFEMYRDTFLDCLDRAGFGSEEQLAELLSVVIEYSFVGDFLDEPTESLPELSAYGLVLLGRMADLDWGRAGAVECFVLHEQLFECFEYVRDAEKRRASARKSANHRHTKTRDAKAFVIGEWQTHRAAYRHNKSAFARDYVRRLKNEFEVAITEKQMREVWLRDTPDPPPARKPDGQPARGE